MGMHVELGLRRVLMWWLGGFGFVVWFVLYRYFVLDLRVCEVFLEYCLLVGYGLC